MTGRLRRELPPALGPFTQFELDMESISGCRAGKRAFNVGLIRILARTCNSRALERSAQELRWPEWTLQSRDPRVT